MTPIRPARLTDALAIARCHVAAWRDTYRPDVADEYLNQMSIEDHAATWEKNLQQAGCHTFVAEEQRGLLIGFVHGGRERAGDIDFAGEIYAIYLLQDCRRQGTGRRLFEQLVGVLLENQITSLIVWALEGNEYRACYAAWGGEQIAAAPIKIGQQDLVEVGYGWRDLRGVANSRTFR